MSLVTEIFNSHLPYKKKETPSGWTSFNAPCCHHRSESPDKRQRGGVKYHDGFVFNCFNCGYSNHFNQYLREYHPHLQTKLSVSLIKSEMPSMYDQNDLVSQLPPEILKHIFYNGNVEMLSKIKLDITKDNQEKLKESFR